MQSSEEGYTVLTAMVDFEKVRKSLLEMKIPMASAELTMIPSQTISVSGEHAQKVQALIEALEENDDVQNVYSNALFEE